MYNLIFYCLFNIYFQVNERHEEQQCGVGRSEQSILTLRILFRVKIYVNTYIEPRNEVKILKKRVLGLRFFTQKLARSPLGRKKKILENIGFIVFKATGQATRFQHFISGFYIYINIDFHSKYNPKCQNGFFTTSCRVML